MTESEVILKGELIGIEYTLFGGRAIRLSAIWDRITNSVRFYDHKLEKFLVTTDRWTDQRSGTDAIGSQSNPHAISLCCSLNDSCQYQQPVPSDSEGAGRRGD